MALFWLAARLRPVGGIGKRSSPWRAFCWIPSSCRQGRTWPKWRGWTAAQHHAQPTKHSASNLTAAEMKSVSNCDCSTWWLDLLSLYSNRISSLYSSHCVPLHLWIDSAAEWVNKRGWNMETGFEPVVTIFSPRSTCTLCVFCWLCSLHHSPALFCQVCLIFQSLKFR